MRKINVRIAGIITLIFLSMIIAQGCTTASDDPLNGSTPDTLYAGDGDGDGAAASETESNFEDTIADEGEGPSDPATEGLSETESAGGDNPTQAEEQAEPQAIDLEAVKPNEAGDILVVMFHNFIEEYKGGDKEYTTTFDAFEQLLEGLYTDGYRLIGMNDYLEGHIDVPPGCIPMVFSFDDGTPGQFNLIEKDGTLVVNPRSAVGIIEKFNENHPDFGNKGIFYINLGGGTFNGAGTMAQRLQYLAEKGFELGNHTYSHTNLGKVKSAEKIIEEIGKNQLKMYEIIPGYEFTSLSLPNGAYPEEFGRHLQKGEFEGVAYENKGIIFIGCDTSPSPFTDKFKPLRINRVRSPGITPVDMDLAWWVSSLKRDRQYVSDGNADTVTVPENKAGSIELSRLEGRKLIIY